MAITCPIDGKDDAMQILSAIVNAGCARSVLTMHGSLASGLTDQLAPPPQPKLIKFLALFGWSFLFYVSIGFIFGPIFVWLCFKKWVASNPTNQKQIFTLGFKIYCIVALMLGWSIILTVLLIPVWNRINTYICAPNRIEQYNEACSIWQRLYYCHRCNIVVDPNNNEYFSPSQLYNYLHVGDYTVR
jgi:hypothetical protein